MEPCTQALIVERCRWLTSPRDIAWCLSETTRTDNGCFAVTAELRCQVFFNESGTHTLADHELRGASRKDAHVKIWLTSKKNQIEMLPGEAPWKQGVINKRIDAVKEMASRVASSVCAEMCLLKKS